MTPTVVARIPQHLEMRLGVQFVDQPARRIIGIYQSPIASFHNKHHAFGFGQLHRWGDEGWHAVPYPMGHVPALRAILAPQYLFLALGHDPHQGRTNNMCHFNHPFERIHM